MARMNGEVPEADEPEEVEESAEVEASVEESDE